MKIQPLTIQTFSVVVGNSSCDGNCPFCVSHTTGFGECPKKSPIDMLGLKKAMRLAEIGKCTTVLLTGKGEPLLFVDEMTQYLKAFYTRLQEGGGFSFVEVQTNGLLLGEIARYFMGGSRVALNTHAEKLYNALELWKGLGLDTIALSVVGINQVDNKKIYLNHRIDSEYPDLALTVKYLHMKGFNVRLCLMMHKGMVDNSESLKNVIDWCRDNKVMQCTARPLRKPTNYVKVDGAESYLEYIDKNGLTEEQEYEIHEWINQLEGKGKARKLYPLAHGAQVYDIDGQNFCLSDCLTMDTDTNDIRTLIFWADGKITFAWQYPSARFR